MSQDVLAFVIRTTLPFAVLISLCFLVIAGFAALIVYIAILMVALRKLKEVIVISLGQRPEVEPTNRAIVYGGKNKLDSGIWGLITDEGEVLANKWCHSCYFAAGSTLCNDPAIQEMLKERNITAFAWLEDCGISKDELLERNHKLNKGVRLESL